MEFGTALLSVCMIYAALSSAASFIVGALKGALTSA